MPDTLVATPDPEPEWAWTPTIYSFAGSSVATNCSVSVVQVLGSPTPSWTLTETTPNI